MRILQIRFKNLNSLAGEWEIDLTHPAFTADGIFAITGPTGAGKTTLLDAICLGLYGRTPRLHRVNRSGNEVMSRHTGECFAEVTFETPTGRYRCHWSQHRARRRPGGELQAPRHEIANADTGEIFETRLRGVAEQIEQATGMDFQRFTRSMLLAQGDFAAFLQAPPDERAPILEQITGTEIYSRISMAVHERRGEARRILEHLQSALEGLCLLSPEEEQQLSVELAAHQARETALRTWLEQQRQAVSWLEGIEKLELAQGHIEKEAGDLEARIQAFAPDQQRLHRARQALELAGDHAALIQLRQAQARDRAQQAAAETRLPAIEVRAQQAADAQRQAQAQRDKARQTLQMSLPVLLKARELDVRIIDRHTALVQSDKTLTLARQRLEALRSEQTGVEGRLQAGRDRVRAQRATLEQEEQDLSAGLERLNREAGVLSQRLCGLEEKATLLETQQNLLQRIKDLESARDQLQDGEPCPLCGALDHPYARGNVPAVDQTQETLEEVRATLKALRQQATDLQICRGQLGKDLEQIDRKRQEFLSHGRDQSAAASDGWGPWEGTALDLPALLEQLQRRHGQWQSRRQALTTLEGELKVLEIGMTHRARQIQDSAEDVGRWSIQSDDLNQSIQTLRAERQQLQVGQAPETEQQQLEAAVEAAEATLESAREQVRRMEDECRQWRIRLEDLHNTLAEREPRLQAAETAFRQRLEALGLADEADFQAACLPEPERRALTLQAQALEAAQAALNARAEDTRRLLAAARKQALTHQPLAVLQEQLTVQEHEHQSVQQAIGGLRQRLTDNDTLRHHYRAQTAAIEAQQRECDRWDQLHELIGSADGKKYRNFAQGLTFDLMIGHANQQLQNMTDRYLLIRDQAQPLELNVIDSYQGGEIRSTKNLSGGEGFIVSLALALGLSRMAGRQVRVDSLFLDEGFGTLDDDALDTALQTLAGLREEGKLIGLISHVSALKERIATRIQVTPQTGGRSRISGPGCRGDA
ncbi:exonuclease SbcC [Ectothiorhodospira magna]|uniref:Exonuclease SbcC n=1 Tax=Ectothiorhodospira magna TaxID=867345 RepID=A0A1H9EWP7_9GAMM|nr:AAA family ATPase [Ectothiorhodospira magna]SEQ29653.1 exonuclease SbcC [Ectothiorhodospira magna]